MKVGSKLQYEMPDECPENCKWGDNFLNPAYSICQMCPVFICKDQSHRGFYKQIHPKGISDEMAELWHNRFYPKEEKVKSYKCLNYGIPREMI